MSKTILNKLSKEENLNDYKGQFFNLQKELRYYENGAHFKYEELCRKLDDLREKFSLDDLKIQRKTNISK